jgi:hypothetical protein
MFSTLFSENRAVYKIVPCYVTAFRASQERRYPPFLTYLQLDRSVPPLLQSGYVPLVYLFTLVYFVGHSATSLRGINIQI